MRPAATYALRGFLALLAVAGASPADAADKSRLAALQAAGAAAGGFVFEPAPAGPVSGASPVLVTPEAPQSSGRVSSVGAETIVPSGRPSSAGILARQDVGRPPGSGDRGPAVVVNYAALDGLRRHDGIEPDPVAPFSVTVDAKGNLAVRDKSTKPVVMLAETGGRKVGSFLPRAAEGRRGPPKEASTDRPGIRLTAAQTVGAISHGPRGFEPGLGGREGQGVLDRRRQLLVSARQVTMASALPPVDRSPPAEPAPAKAGDVANDREADGELDASDDRRPGHSYDRRTTKSERVSSPGAAATPTKRTAPTAGLRRRDAMATVEPLLSFSFEERSAALTALQRAEISMLGKHQLTGPVTVVVGAPVDDPLGSNRFDEVEAALLQAGVRVRKHRYDTGLPQGTIRITTN